MAKKDKKKKDTKHKVKRTEKPLKLNMSFQEAMLKIVRVKPKSA